MQIGTNRLPTIGIGLPMATASGWLFIRITILQTFAKREVKTMTGGNSTLRANPLDQYLRKNESPEINTLDENSSVEESVIEASTEDKSANAASIEEETFSETPSQNTETLNPGWRSRKADKNEHELNKRKEPVKANDPLLQKRMAKQSIADFTNKNSFFEKIGIKPITENETICDYFNRFNEAIISSKEKYGSELNQQVLDTYQQIDETNKAFNSLMLPRQIMLGIMLNVLKDDGEEMNKFIKNLNLPQRTCYHYMNAAAVVPHITQDCVYNLGMMVLAGLGEYFKKHSEEYQAGGHAFDDQIIHYMEPPLKLEEGKAADFYKDYNRRVAYFYYQHGFFAKYNIGREEYKELFESNYEWSYREAKRIKEATLAPKQAGQKEREILHPDGINEAIKTLADGFKEDPKQNKIRNSINNGCKNIEKELEKISDKIYDINNISAENKEYLSRLKESLEKFQQKLDSSLSQPQ